jgi:hypothetical protein
MGAGLRDGRPVTVPTLAAWLEEWCASRRHHLEASSTASYRVMADAYLLPHLGDVPLDQLAVAQVGEAVQVTRPKTGRTRTLSLDPATAGHLARRMRAAPTVPADAPVFGDARGGHLLPQRVSDIWRAYVRTLDLPPIRLHDLRHTHATLLLAAGVPVKVVSERLGHTKVAMTLDVYAHVLPAMDRDAADRFGQLLAAPTDEAVLDDVDAHT